MAAVDVKRGSLLEPDVEARALLASPAMAATAGRSAWGRRLGVVALLVMVVGLVSAWLVARPTWQRSHSADLVAVMRLDGNQVRCQYEKKHETKHNASFVCGSKSTCCGDVCVGKNGKCCTGRKGQTFGCGPNSTCCGDSCLGMDGICCENTLGEFFPCGKGGACCGNTCKPVKGRCCTNGHGYKYATSAASPCIDELKNCTNLRGDLFYCGTGSECCGDGCMAPGAVCCKNNAGFEAFSCGQFSTCCGNTCAAPGSRCCVNKGGNKYPVAGHAGGFEYPWEKQIYENCSKAAQ